MSHTIHHTEAIVLGNSPAQEASKFLFLLTKDFGLITAHVRAVREVSSKLRFSLQDVSYARIDLVLGKYGWKITSAEYIDHFHFLDESLGDHYAKTISHITVLLRRLIKGEERNEVLFERVLDGFMSLKKNQLTFAQLKSFEAVLVVQILHILGYWGEDPRYAELLVSPLSFPEILEHVEAKKSLVIQEINKSLRATQL